MKLYIYTLNCLSVSFSNSPVKCLMYSRNSVFMHVSQENLGGEIERIGGNLLLKYFGISN